MTLIMFHGRAGQSATKSGALLFKPSHEINFYNSLVKVHGKEMCEPQQCYIKICVIMRCAVNGLKNGPS